MKLGGLNEIRHLKNMIPKSRKVLLPLILLLAMAACNDPARLNSKGNKATPVNTLTANKVVENDSIIFDDFHYPVDSAFTTKVLPTGIFHGDEVWNNASVLQWFGLFKGQDGYYLKQTEIKTERVNDAIVDENESDKTGWRVQALNKDSCLILIESLPFLTDRNIQSVKLSNEFIYPGDTVSIKYSGINYKIYAKGGKKQIPNQPDWFEVWNYRLYITATIKGQERKTLLIAQPNGDDRMINIIFAGDIDGDGILDLLIDTTDDYNVSIPTIYLSKPAANGEVVKPIGGHKSVGC